MNKINNCKNCNGTGIVSLGKGIRGIKQCPVCHGKRDDEVVNASEETYSEADNLDSYGGIVLVYDDESKAWKKKEEPFATIECNTEKDFNRLQHILNVYENLGEFIKSYKLLTSMIESVSPLIKAEMDLALNKLGYDEKDS